MATVPAFLPDPLDVIVFIGCGRIEKQVWLAVVSGIIYDRVTLYVFVNPNVDRRHDRGNHLRTSMT